MDVGRTYDTVVIGGGASGLAAALTAAREGRRVCVIERDVACGLKILATGNGRCNLSNASLDTARYLHPTFAGAVLGEAPERELERFFASLGILTAREDDRLYPYSFRAESVRDALIDACRRAGLDMICGAFVVAASRDANGTWSLTVRHPAGKLRSKPQRDRKAELRARRRALAEAKTVEDLYSAQSVIIAVGDAVGDLAPLFGLPSLPPSPVLCPVSATVPGAEPGALEVLNGLRAHTRLTLRRDHAPLWSEEGEILFRPFGISGVVVFNLSRRIRRGDTLLIDFFPDLDEDRLRRLLDGRSRVMGPFSAQDPSWFDGLIAPALARVVCDICGRRHPGTDDVTHIVHILKEFKLHIAGIATDQPSQVTRGGIPVDAVEAPSLACTDPKLAGLSVCGEALDMDADCGGFNLAWAWISGMRAAGTL